MTKILDYGLAFFLLFSVSTFETATVHAQTYDLSNTVAILEMDASGDGALDLNDFLSAGRKFDLKDDESIVISYLHECLVEHITGGKVVVDDSKSRVTGGNVERSHAYCAHTQFCTVNDGIIRKAIGFGAPRKGEIVLDWVVFDPSPLIVLADASISESSITISEIESENRIPKSTEEIATFDAAGGILDLAHHEIVLENRTFYRLDTGSLSTVFRTQFSSRASEFEKSYHIVRLLPFCPGHDQRRFEPTGD